MQASVTVLARLFVAALVAVPSTASADWVVTPFVGWNFHGTADVSGNGGDAVPVSKFNHKVDYGASLDWMGKGIVGAELDFGYSPNFFASTANSNAVAFPTTATSRR